MQIFLFKYFLLSSSQVAGFPRGGPAPPLLAGSGGFRPFFGGPPPLHGHRMGPPPPHGPANHTLPIRHNATHLHPQHRRMLTQRMQNRIGYGSSNTIPYTLLRLYMDSEGVSVLHSTVVPVHGMQTLSSMLNLKLRREK